MCTAESSRSLMLSTEEQVKKVYENPYDDHRKRSKQIKMLGGCFILKIAIRNYST